jgi:hypothetical protein
VQKCLHVNDSLITKHYEFETVAGALAHLHRLMKGLREVMGNNFKGLRESITEAKTKIIDEAMLENLQKMQEKISVKALQMGKDLDTTASEYAATFQGEESTNIDTEDLDIVKDVSTLATYNGTFTKLFIPSKKQHHLATAQSVLRGLILGPSTEGTNYRNSTLFIPGLMFCSTAFSPVLISYLPEDISGKGFSGNFSLTNGKIADDPRVVTHERNFADEIEKYERAEVIKDDDPKKGRRLCFIYPLGEISEKEAETKKFTFLNEMHKSTKKESKDKEELTTRFKSIYLIKDNNSYFLVITFPLEYDRMFKGDGCWLYYPTESRCIHPIEDSVYRMVAILKEHIEDKNAPAKGDFAMYHFTRDATAAATNPTESGFYKILGQTIQYLQVPNYTGMGQLLLEDVPKGHKNINSKNYVNSVGSEANGKTNDYSVATAMISGRTASGTTFSSSSIDITQESIKNALESETPTGDAATNYLKWIYVHYVKFVQSFFYMNPDSSSSSNPLVPDLEYTKATKAALPDNDVIAHNNFVLDKYPQV